ncbi:hypothetical protein DY000_02047932 [Brassica cretica]|uniref:Uncharacterized protein n=1 Tax=Brassica cretica TaxID=69181 RepID=A0ABQ7F4G1_BRACR|nr:hypothetical protein DY000_02047932 [Brassica cretica]
MQSTCLHLSVEVSPLAAIQHSQRKGIIEAEGQEEVNNRGVAEIRTKDVLRVVGDKTNTTKLTSKYP